MDRIIALWNRMQPKIRRIVEERRNADAKKRTKQRSKAKQPAWGRDFVKEFNEKQEHVKKVIAGRKKKGKESR